MDRSNPSKQEIVGEQLIEYITKSKHISLGEGTAACQSRDDELSFDDTHLDIDLDLARSATEMTLPDLYVGFEIDLLAPGDEVGIGRDKAASDHHESADGVDQISGQISPNTLSKWLRYGCEQVIQLAGATACHPDVLADDSRVGVPKRDLGTGYHESGTCTEEYDTGCLVYELFGGRDDQQGKLVCRPISVLTAHREGTASHGETHYRQSRTQVHSRHTENGQPPRQTDSGVLVTIRGVWRLTLSELKPEFIGLIAESMSFLDSHSDVTISGGSERPIDISVANVWLVNPLYTDDEVRRMFSPALSPTMAMAEKDEYWRRDCRNAFTRAVQARTAARDGDLPVPAAGEKG